MEPTSTDIQVIVAQIVIFIVLWMVLKRLWFDPVAAVLRERARRSDGAVADAEAVRAEVEKLRADHAAALAEARAEAQREVQEILRGAEAEQRRIVEEASSAAERTLDDARARIAAQVDAARADVRAEAGTIARNVAETVLGRGV